MAVHSRTRLLLSSVGDGDRFELGKNKDRPRLHNAKGGESMARD